MKNEELDHIIEKSFAAEPDFHLPADFAKRLTSSIIRNEQWKIDLREYLYLTTILVFLLTVACGAYYYIDKSTVLRFFNYIAENTLPIVFMAFILNFILFADRVLLRLLFNRWKRVN